MTNLINLQRDQFHADPESAERVAGNGTPVAKGSNLNINAPATVFSSEGACFSLGNVDTLLTGEWAGFGVHMEPPRLDSTPYRVHGYAYGPPELYVVIGYAPLAPTGVNDPLTKCIGIPIKDGWIDEIFLVPAITDDQHVDFGKPVSFALAFGETSSICEGAISVQNMAKASPTFASSSS